MNWNEEYGNLLVAHNDGWRCCLTLGFRHDRDSLAAKYATALERWAFELGWKMRVFVQSAEG